MEVRGSAPSHRPQNAGMGSEDAVGMWAPGRSLRALVVALVAVAVVACAVLSGARAGWRRPEELLGAADFNSISGKATIFWGEEEGVPGRYPPEYAAQLKKMRKLVKRVKMNNDRSKALLKEEEATIREIKREMETEAEDSVERLMTNTDNYKADIAQLEPRAGMPATYALLLCVQLTHKLMRPRSRHVLRPSSHVLDDYPSHAICPRRVC
jgi:hypothetical protein